MMTQDDRTPEQLDSHRWLIVGTDKFLSGWGEAQGGTSVAAWACTEDQKNDCLCWVERRGDMKRVREVYESEHDARRYRPRNAAHFHVYVWKPQAVQSASA